MAYYELATDADDAEMRSLLRENPFSGAISLSLEREPNYFLASAVAGSYHQTLVVRDSVGRLIGMGDRSVRALYVNGEVQDVGYYSGLRTGEPYRRGLALARFLGKGFEGQREMHKDGRAKFYLISIISDNGPARRLIDSGLPGYPCLEPYTRMFTYAIHPRQIREDSRLQVTCAAVNSLDAILDCLERNGRRSQFAPRWTRETLLSPLTPDLSISDFFLARSGERIVGCIALWDQQRFKQSVVRGYSGAIARVRKLTNLFSVAGGRPRLPEPGTRLNQCFACFFAVDDDDPEIVSALLRAVYNEAARRKYEFLLLGLAEASPLHAMVKAYRPITYESQIYLAAWPDGIDAIHSIDARPAGLEIAVL